MSPSRKIWEADAGPLRTPYLYYRPLAGAFTSKVEGEVYAPGATTPPGFLDRPRVRYRRTKEILEEGVGGYKFFGRKIVAPIPRPGSPRPYHQTWFGNEIANKYKHAVPIWAQRESDKATFHIGWVPATGEAGTTLETLLPAISHIPEKSTFPIQLESLEEGRWFYGGSKIDAKISVFEPYTGMPSFTKRTLPRPPSLGQILKSNWGKLLGGIAGLVTGGYLFNYLTSKTGGGEDPSAPPPLSQPTDPEAYAIQMAYGQAGMGKALNEIQILNKPRHGDFASGSWLSGVWSRFRDLWGTRTAEEGLKKIGAAVVEGMHVPMSWALDVDKAISGHGSGGYLLDYKSGSPERIRYLFKALGKEKAAALTNLPKYKQDVSLAVARAKRYRLREDLSNTRRNFYADIYRGGGGGIHGVRDTSALFVTGLEGGPARKIDARAARALFTSPAERARYRETVQEAVRWDRRAGVSGLKETRKYKSTHLRLTRDRFRREHGNFNVIWSRSNDPEENYLGQEYNHFFHSEGTPALVFHELTEQDHTFRALRTGKKRVLNYGAIDLIRGTKGEGAHTDIGVVKEELRFAQLYDFIHGTSHLSTSLEMRRREIAVMEYLASGGKDLRPENVTQAGGALLTAVGSFFQEPGRKTNTTKHYLKALRKMLKAFEKGYSFPEQIRAGTGNTRDFFPAGFIEGIESRPFFDPSELKDVASLVRERKSKILREGLRKLKRVDWPYLIARRDPSSAKEEYAKLVQSDLTHSSKYLIELALRRVERFRPRNSLTPIYSEHLPVVKLTGIKPTSVERAHQLRSALSQHFSFADTIERRPPYKPSEYEGLIDFIKKKAGLWNEKQKAESLAAEGFQSEVEKSLYRDIRKHPPRKAEWEDANPEYASYTDQDYEEQYHSYTRDSEPPEVSGDYGGPGPAPEPTVDLGGPTTGDLESDYRRGPAEVYDAQPDDFHDGPDYPPDEDGFSEPRVVWGQAREISIARKMAYGQAGMGKPLNEIEILNKPRHGDFKSGSWLKGAWDKFRTHIVPSFSAIEVMEKLGAVKGVSAAAFKPNPLKLRGAAAAAFDTDLLRADYKSGVRFLRKGYPTKMSKLEKLKLRADLLGFKKSKDYTEKFVYNPSLLEPKGIIGFVAKKIGLMPDMNTPALAAHELFEQSYTHTSKGKRLIRYGANSGMFANAHASVGVVKEELRTAELYDLAHPGAGTLKKALDIRRGEITMLSVMVGGADLLDLVEPNRKLMATRSTSLRYIKALDKMIEKYEKGYSFAAEIDKGIISGKGNVRDHFKAGWREEIKQIAANASGIRDQARRAAHLVNSGTKPVTPKIHVNSTRAGGG